MEIISLSELSKSTPQQKTSVFEVIVKTVLPLYLVLSKRFVSYSSSLRKLASVVLIFQSWIYYVVLPTDPNFPNYQSSFRLAIRYLLSLENGFWTSSFIFPFTLFPFTWIGSTLSHCLSSYLTVDHMLMSAISDRIKNWTFHPTHLRCSWQKSSSDPIISLVGRLYNGVSTNSVRIKEVSVLNRTFFLFYRSCHYTQMKKVILWIPGGGFHALGPKDYLSVGAILSQIAPTIVIDYPKSPENPFPEALQWIFNAVELFFSESLQHLSIIFDEGRRFVDEFSFSSLELQQGFDVIIAGDSAGGNFALTLAAELSEKPFSNMKIKGLVMVYPLLSFEISGWVDAQDQSCRAKIAPHLVGSHLAGGPFCSRLAIPSRFLNMGDRIIRPDILFFLAQVYLATPESSIESIHQRCLSPSDPQLTPLKLPLSQIQKIPNLFIQIGELDPFLDDSLLLFHRCLGTNEFKSSSRVTAGIKFTTLDGTYDEHKISLSLIEGVSHGYLQMQLLWSGFHFCLQEILTVIEEM